MDITLNGRIILAEDAEPGLIEAATNVLSFLVDESQTADLSTADCWSTLFDNNHDDRADSFMAAAMTAKARHISPCPGQQERKVQYD